MVKLILVDTSVLIDYLKGIENVKTCLFEKVIKQKIPFGISSYTYQEVLQGARDDKEFNELKEYLSSQNIFYLPEDIETYNDAAQMFYRLRLQEITVRSTIDILIALTCVKYDLILMHNDKDFDMIKSQVHTLRVLDELL